MDTDKNVASLTEVINTMYHLYSVVLMASFQSNLASWWLHSGLGESQSISSAELKPSLRHALYKCTITSHMCIVGFSYLQVANPICESLVAFSKDIWSKMLQCIWKSVILQVADLLLLLLLKTLIFRLVSCY